MLFTKFLRIVVTKVLAGITKEINLSVDTETRVGFRHILKNELCNSKFRFEFESRFLKPATDFKFSDSLTPDTDIRDISHLVFIKTAYIWPDRLVSISKVSHETKLMPAGFVVDARYFLRR